MPLEVEGIGGGGGGGGGGGADPASKSLLLGMWNFLFRRFLNLGPIKFLLENKFKKKYFVQT